MSGSLFTVAHDEPTVQQAVRLLAGVDDYARSWDSQGFNKFDAEFGQSLASRRDEYWTPKQLRSAWRMLRKYRGQLADMGLAFDEIPEPADPITLPAVTWVGRPEAPAAPRPGVIPGRRAHLVQSQGLRSVIILSPYNPGLVEAVKRLPGRSYDGASRAWTVPLDDESIPEVAEFLGNWKFDRDEPLGTLIDSRIEAARAASEAAQRRRALSQAHDADMVIEGLGGTLYPFQRAGIAYALEAKRTFICDEQGLGKTIEALGVLEVAQAYPALVVCTATCKPNWRRQIAKWLPAVSCSVLNGSAPDLFATRADIVITNYDALDKWKVLLADRPWKAVVIDESHKLKTPRALRTTRVGEIIDTHQPEYRLFLTGTPILNRPAEFISQLEMLGRLEDVVRDRTGQRLDRDQARRLFKQRYVNGMRLKDLNDRLRAHCLPYDALVATEHGAQQIGDLVRAARPVQVWAYSERTGRASLQPAVGFRESPRREAMVRVVIGGAELRCTADHPVGTPTGYVRAEDLAPGDDVLVLRSALRDDLARMDPPSSLLLSPVFPSGGVSQGAVSSVDGRTTSAGGRGSVGGEAVALAHPRIGREDAGRIAGGTLQADGSPAIHSHLASSAELTCGFGLARGVAGVPGRVGTSVWTLRFGCDQLALGRPREPSVPRGDRGGWPEPSGPSTGTDRQVETGDVAVARVDRVEVLEPRPDRAAGFGPSRDPLVYDLEIAEDHNFFVTGVLVHNCMVRRLKSEVLTELPPKQYDTQVFRLDNREEYDRAENDIIAWIELRASQEETFLASLTALSEVEKAEAVKAHGQDARRRAERAEALVKIGSLKMLAARGILASAVAWVKDWLESGEKLVIFADHVEFQKALAAAFPGCAVLMGMPHQKPDERDREQQRFQNDPTCRLAVCSLGAAGEGIDLFAATHVALLELGWTPGGVDQAADRLHRIGQTDNVTVSYLVAENSIYEWVAELIDEKRKVVTAATDGEEVQESSMLGELMARFRAKGRQKA